METISACFSDGDQQVLCARLTALAQAERALKVEFLRVLGEFDERRLSLELGYSSTHAFLVERLGMSGGSAFRRVTAARLLRKIPAIAGYVEAGRLSLTKLGTHQDVLTIANADELVERAAGLTEREVESLAVR